MKCDILVKDCTVMMQDYSTPGHMAVAIDQSMVLEVGPTKEMEERYQGITVLDGRGKLVMPGLTDGHTHVCQQLLRGRISDEFPMIWTRFLVPFERSLTEEDVAASARLACLQMIKSGRSCPGIRNEGFPHPVHHG